MNTVMLFTGSGCLVILTSHASITDPALLEKLAVKGIEKFIAFEIPVQLAQERYGGHFFVVARTLHEIDDLRILDYNGDRAFKLFPVRGTRQSDPLRRRKHASERDSGDGSAGLACGGRFAAAHEPPYDDGTQHLADRHREHARRRDSRPTPARKMPLSIGALERA